MWWRYKSYVSVAQRRAKAEHLARSMAKKGQPLSPVRLEGRTIARTFWGKGWCEHLESYSDYENRLPRGRSYVRNGSVIDLKIAPGKITAMVSGSELYKLSITVKPLAPARWASIKGHCAGRIGSVIELLQGRMSAEVMRIITDRENGMFPSPAEIDLDCSCPDWADMCKHVAAVLYGIGARLDFEPELLFTLRQVDPMELIEQATSAEAIARTSARGAKTIAEADVADVFGIELESAPAAAGAPRAAGADDTGAKNPPARKARRQAAAKPKATRPAEDTAPPSKPRGTGRGPAKKAAKPRGQARRR